MEDVLEVYRRLYGLKCPVVCLDEERRLGPPSQVSQISRVAMTRSTSRWERQSTY